MANIIIKSDDRRAREHKILNDLGPGKNASLKDREFASCIAEKTYEQMKKMKSRER